MYTAGDDVRGASLRSRRSKYTLPTPDTATPTEEFSAHPDPLDELISEVQRLIEINKNMSEIQAQTPPYYDFKRSPARCGFHVPGNPLEDSARAESPYAFLCPDAHLVASIGQSHADGIPCRSATIDEVLKAPICWGYGQPPTNMLLQGFFGP
ncbi:hypothetical protein EVAR_8585_1 [Eumeta japonica]|uniref:Uncharacterized protein n=1 Tax=Eumeta variegata TaxID=151549 RepID=A0A4C2A8J1_EUMVA|nr:hypothetical protein EVAR_8585_1 [Eumeta japonica]